MLWDNKSDVHRFFPVYSLQIRQQYGDSNRSSVGNGGGALPGQCRGMVRALTPVIAIPISLVHGIFSRIYIITGAQAESVWVLWGGCEYNLGSKMRCTEGPLGKWWMVMARLDSSARQILGMEIVVAVVRSGNRWPPPQLRHLWVLVKEEGCQVL